MITLVNSKFAKIGFKFFHEGEAPECKDCKLRKTCIENLELSRMYEVKEVRKIKHHCPICGDVKVVVVREPEFEVRIDSRRAIEGLTFTLDEKSRYPGLKSGDKLRILRVLSEERGKRRVQVLRVLEL